MRTSETLYKDGDKSFGNDYRALTKDPDVNVVMQAMLTLNLFKVADIAAIVKDTQAANPARGVQELGTRILAPPAAGRGGRGRTPEETAFIERGETIYKELCLTCHGTDGLGTPKEGAPAGTTMAPPLVGSLRVQGHRDYVIKALLHGLAGPIDGDTYTEVMVPMGTNKDDWIAAAASFVRTGFGNTGAAVTAADVARVRQATLARKKPWTVEELTASLPVLLPAQPTWKVSASHNTRERHQRLELRRVVNRRAAEARDVVPGRVAGAGDAHRVLFETTAGGRGGVPTGAFGITGPCPARRCPHSPRTQRPARPRAPPAPGAAVAPVVVVVADSPLRSSAFRVSTRSRSHSTG